MFGRYVKVFSILLSCYFLIVVVFEGYEGAAVRVCSCIAREHVNDYVCPVGRYPLPCKRYPTVITTSSPYLHAYGSCRYDSTVGSPACAAQTGLGSPKRGCCMTDRMLVPSPANPAFLTASPDYVSEASLAGEWELRFYPDGPWEEMSALVAGARETSADEVSAFLVALKELCRSPARPSISVNTVRSPFAPLSHPSIQLKLQPDRLGIPKDTRFPPVVWQLKQRPYSTLYVELEMAFLPDNPQFMLVFEAPVSPGKHFPQATYVQEGTVSFAIAPFLPWQKRKIGKFTLTPKTLRTVVDPVLL